MPKIRVFISSKQSEFKSERLGIFDILEQSGYADPVMAEDWSPQRQSVEKTFLEEVASCPIYVGLFGRIFSQPTEAEYRKALENPAREVLIYVKNCAEREAQMQKLVTQLNEAQQGHTIRVYTTWPELRPFFLRHIRDSLSRMIARYLELAWGSSRGGGGEWSITAKRQLAILRSIGLPVVDSPQGAHGWVKQLQKAQEYFDRCGLDHAV